jgi:hypothetical protein
VPGASDWISTLGVAWTTRGTDSDG